MAPPALHLAFASASARLSGTTRGTPASAVVPVIALVLCHCGAPDVPERPLAPSFSYVAVTLPGDPVALHALQAGERIVVAIESEDERGLTLSAIALGPDGSERAPLVRLGSGLRRAFGVPSASGDGVLWGGLRGSDDGRQLDLVRWSPGEPPDLVATCPLAAVDGLVAPDGDGAVVVFEAQDGDLRGFRLALDAPACPDADAVALLLPGPLPADYRLDWLDGQLVVSGQWGDTVALRVFGASFEPMRHLRLTSGGAVQTRDLSFLRSVDGAWSVVYAARVDGARDVYESSLGQLRAGPLEARRVIATAEWEQLPSLRHRGAGTIAHWVVESQAGDEWIELAGVLSPHGIALPGGEVVWRRPRGDALLATSLWTEAGLLRIAVDRGAAPAVLTVSPYRPSFW